MFQDSKPVDIASLLSDSLAHSIDLHLYFFDNLPDAFLVRIDNDIIRAGRNMQPKIICIAFITALFVPLCQRFPNFLFLARPHNHL